MVVRFWLRIARADVIFPCLNCALRFITAFCSATNKQAVPCGFAAVSLQMIGVSLRTITDAPIFHPRDNCNYILND